MTPSFLGQMDFEHKARDGTHLASMKMRCVWIAILGTGGSQKASAVTAVIKMRTKVGLKSRL